MGGGGTVPWSSRSRRSLASPHLPLSRHCVHGVGQGGNVAVICGVGTTEMTVRGKLQALVYDILPSLWHCSATGRTKRTWKGKGAIVEY